MFSSCTCTCNHIIDFVCVLEMNIFQLALRMCNKTDMSVEASKVYRMNELINIVYMVFIIRIIHVHVHIVYYVFFSCICTNTMYIQGEKYRKIFTCIELLYSPSLVHIHVHCTCM